MKRHVLAAAFDQRQFPTISVVNLARADQQISNWFHIHLALRGIIQAMSELGGQAFSSAASFSWRQYSFHLT
jgi:hypothetical protein